MRRDIELHIETGDVGIGSRNKPQFRGFRWVEEPSLLSRYIYGEIDIPYNISNKSIYADGVYVIIPYTPIYKEFMVRIRRVREDGSYIYVTNDVDGSHWFVVRVSAYGSDWKNMFVSELPAISEDGFYINIENGVAKLYSSNQSDFNVVKANRQNSNCLLACVPGGNYRYPLTGVGLIRWVNSTNVSSTDLTKTLQNEFAADGCSVKRAIYDYDTHQLELSIEVTGDN